MNLLHLADLHLGKRVNGFDLLPDQRYILEQVLDLCTAHNVQAVALAGDIYDTALPPAAAVLLLDWFLTELAHRNIPVLAIAGNHDSAERLDYAAGLLSNQQVYLAGQFTSAPRRVILQDEFGELTFDLLPLSAPPPCATACRMPISGMKIPPSPPRWARCPPPGSVGF